MKKVFSALCIAFAAAALFASSGYAAETLIKIGHVLNTDHCWHKNLSGFADEVKKDTDGRVVIPATPALFVLKYFSNKILLFLHRSGF